jgi:plasmid stability protein
MAQALHLRGVEDGLVRELRLRAVREGKTLREVCLEGLGRHVGVEVGEAVGGEMSFEPDAVGGGKVTIAKRVVVGHAVGCKCFRCRPPKVVVK